jgi:uracil-DNA glycosylase
MATIHPSALLRLPDEMSRAAEMQRFISDLELVRGVLAAEHAS